MSDVELTIHWHHAIEYIVLDLKKPPRKGDCVHTVESWPEEEDPIAFLATCIESRSTTSKLLITLEYSPRNNRELVGINHAWGASTISVDTKSKVPRICATWKDSKDKSRNASVTGTLHSIKLLQKRRDYETVNRLKRGKQADFRRTMLERDKKCAISKEKTHAALEAAHIVDLQLRGAFSPANGILLRADLHRLFDKNLLRIFPDGSIWFSKVVSKYYRDQFQNLHLSPVLLRRVADALKAKETGFGSKHPGTWSEIPDYGDTGPAPAFLKKLPD